MDLVSLRSAVISLVYSFFVLVKWFWRSWSIMDISTAFPMWQQIKFSPLQAHRSNDNARRKKNYRLSSILCIAMWLRRCKTIPPNMHRMQLTIFNGRGLCMLLLPHKSSKEKPYRMPKMLKYFCIYMRLNPLTLSMYILFGDMCLWCWCVIPSLHPFRWVHFK